VSGVDARAVVARKRDGLPLSASEIEGFVEAFTSGSIPRELVAAFLMAVYLRGLTPEETAALTRAYVASGNTIELRRLGRPAVDKHSTGGVGDTVTLIFAPLAAAVGLCVAKLSGRGLGHTGGTIDKLEAIPGLRTDLSAAQLERQAAEVGCAIAAQGPDVVPADGAIYAIRDATATVESIPLIAASVMSKKLAVGSDLMLLDVKAGSGAFMKTSDDAGRLADACSGIARAEGRALRAAVTDMSQPLGRAIGNALDVAEAVAVLSGEVGGRLRELTVAFAAAALVALSGLSENDATRRAARALDDGTALERFRDMVSAQGGDPRVADDPAAVLPTAPLRAPVVAADAGFVAAIDAEVLGRASRGLGAGRAHPRAAIDHAVGVTIERSIGDDVDRGEPLAVVHGRDDAGMRRAVDAVRSAFTLSPTPARPPQLVIGWVA
jgi:pyrimidine-nucleoside phosphorylase